MIPKIIHYCWFGSSPLPYEFLTYIDGWKKIFPEFEIKCWDETTFDIFASLPFVQEAYQVKSMPSWLTMCVCGLCINMVVSIWILIFKY